MATGEVHATMSRTTASRLRLLAIVFVAVFCVGSSTWAASASWTANPVGLGGTVSAATVSVTSTLTVPPTAQFAVPVTSPTTADTTHLGALTYANTGTAPLALAVSATNSNATLAAKVVVTLWSATTAALCGSSVPTTGTTVGTLNGTLALPPAVASLPGTSSIALCFALRLTGTTAEFQGQAVTATFALTGTVGTNWSASASSAVTQTVYRVATPGTITCSASGSGTVSLNFTPVTGATGYRLLRTGTTTTEIKTFTAPPVSLSASELPLLSVGTVPLAVQAVDSTYGTTSGNSATSVQAVILLTLLGLSC
ncbi:hypothetical protein NVV95_14445 [Herbiconiux sp. CPCC 205716]|uniref:Ig-like domain-containing protein n=1 Tax=Herbiconiux gentiana TaxID=2970912 RepID=A0ABT2GHP7_9MICO|nr:hypothetical protein [Herbiconiux gentiana]MCS5715747.1 hypothetical protein [Herbiconiux gentiana]